MPAACDTISGGNYSVDGDLAQAISAGSSSSEAGHATARQQGRAQQQAGEENVPARTLRKRLQVQATCTPWRPPARRCQEAALQALQALTLTQHSHGPQLPCRGF
jgi:hypothetical protein